MPRGDELHEHGHMLIATTGKRSDGARRVRLAARRETTRPMIRRLLHRAIDNTEAAAVLVVGACILLRGFLLEPPSEKPATKRARDANSKERVWS